MPGSAMLGRFHELSLRTTDIRASVEFYESLGFSHCTTSDTWPHPYGVMTDGRIYLGLHEYKFPSPSITFVRPGIQEAVRQFEALGIKLAFAKLADDSFNEFGFVDPAGQMSAVLEARTYFPTERRIQDVSSCGYFTEFSFPATAFESGRAFWEQLGFVALEETETPYLRLPLTSDGIDLALHRPRTFEQPLLVFTDPEMRARVAALREAGLSLSAELPRGLDPDANALLLAPEGTALLLLTGET